jgi:sialidase-1
MVVWHKYRDSSEGGSDFGDCSIYSKTSENEGLTWGNERQIVPLCPGDLNVQAPALCYLPNGELLLICMRAHARDSSTMELFRSNDDGETFSHGAYIWQRSNGQWLQGGASCLLRLKSGRLLLPFHGGTGTQGSQHNIVKCYISDDLGKAWHLSSGSLDLPMRGAMEASVAELESGKLVMSLRTQLGSVFISRSDDGGETWEYAQTSGLKSGESCSCLRTAPDGSLLLFWNDADYLPFHHHYGLRTPLSAARSTDGGYTWTRLGNIADGNYEYTNLGCTFISNKTAIVTYTAVIDPDAMDIKNNIPFKRNGLDLCIAILEIS